MTAQRFIGVARPPDGTAADPPRTVIGVARPPNGAVADPPRTVIGVARPPNGAVADPPRAVIDLAGRSPRSDVILAVSPAPPQRKRRRLVVVPHRRQRVPRAAWRGVEMSAWMACVVVIVTVAAILATGVDLSVRWREPANAAVGSSPDCAFVPCAARPFTGNPTRLRITSLGVDEPLDVLHLDANRELIPPKSYDKPGWFGEGIVPGEQGAAVIAGHVDSSAGPGIFYELYTLGIGDVVDVLRGDQWVSFRVMGTGRYPKDEFPSARVYGPTPLPELRLITCGGTFDRRAGSYRDNVVVYAILIDRA